jgi:predicted Rossmann fold flavoprotein
LIHGSTTSILPGKQLIVIGGGAAGFFCAINAARLNPGLSVTILEKTGKLLSKVRISGGGRCNVTHHLFDITEMSRLYPRGQHFVKKSFHSFFTTDTIKWFSERGVKLKAEADGRMFPVTDSSETIIQCLMNEVNATGVSIRMNTEVTAIEKKEGKFQLSLRDGKTLSTGLLCIACGGYPKASMFDWLKATGHAVSDPVPSLFTFNLPKHPISALMGVAINPARVRIEGSKLQEEGPVLITHWGLSGPAVLRLSAWGARELGEKNYQFTIHVNWLPAFSETQVKDHMKMGRANHPTKQVGNDIPGSLPSRFWNFLLEYSGIRPDTRFADLTAKSENFLVRNVVDFVAEVKGKTTFKEEFVTAGGISLSEVDPNTMESKKIPGLYFAGEILDVDGITGGFNFQHAWTSGWIAARSIAGA